MKKRSYLWMTLLAALVVMTLPVTAGPKSFEGVVTYKITYPDNKFSESQMAMFPKVMTITIKGDMAKSEIQTPMGAQVEITNYAEKNKVGLINMMGQKYAIKETTEEIMNDMQSEPTPQISITDETKTIAGYTCKKALVTVTENGASSNYEVWFSEEFGAPNANFDNPLYREIPGVLLEFSMVTPQFTMVFSAISVEKKNISSKEFEIPSDFTIITKEELQSKMGGGM